MDGDGAEDVIVAINSTTNLGSSSRPSSSLSFLGGILCAKASMLLQVSHKCVISIHCDMYFFILVVIGPSGEISLHLALPDFYIFLNASNCDLQSLNCET